MSEKRHLLIIISLIAIIALILAIIFIKDSFFIKNSKNEVNVVFSFIDENAKERNIEVFTDKFNPDAIVVTIDDIDYSNLVSVDDSKLNLSKLGKYEVKYYLMYKDKRYEQVQIINVIDTTPPTITLDGGNVIMLIGENYEETGYSAKDNYDGEITDKVEIENEIDNAQVGDYRITYRVSDISGNKAEVTRIITVKKPNIVIVEQPKEEKIDPPKVIESSYNNTLKKNKFNSNNIHLEGYIKNPLDENKIKIVGDETYEFIVNVSDSNYSIDINPEEINNGKYVIYINDEPLLNKIADIERISRAKIGSKLVTFTYNDKDEVNLEITNHAYQYDILINPGHGGEDTGAVNEYIAEKEMNLIVSMYEKCRYESHGLSVYMTRTTDDYGANFGPSGLKKLHKLGYEMGYYGAVSKIVYSNHHNSISNNYYSGYEILVPGSLTMEELANELAIADKWNSIFNLTESHKRFYSRNYDTDSIHSKLNGEVYSFKDYYAINRIPLTTSNVKSIIFKDSYISNKDEFKWYWQHDNWYKVSEAKIEIYVNALGLTYDNDNSSCLQ